MQGSGDPGSGVGLLVDMGHFLTQLASGSGVSQALYWPTGGWDQIPGWLAKGPKVSQSWCWPASGQGWGPRGPRAGPGLLEGGLHPAMAGCRAVVVLRLVSTHSWYGRGPGGSWDWCLPTDV